MPLHSIMEEIISNPNVPLNQNFWFCFATSDYEMNIFIISFVVFWSCSFLRPCGETRRFLSAFGGSSISRYRASFMLNENSDMPILPSGVRLWLDFSIVK